MSVPGGRSGVLLIILAVWTIIFAGVFGLAMLGWADDIAAYDRFSARFANIGTRSTAEWALSYGVYNPWPDITASVGLMGCIWLPIAVALLIAAVALWSGRK